MSLRPNSRTEVRKKSYKIGVDADEARRRREDNLVEIRKNKREDNLLKKRREGMLLQSQPQPLVNDAAQNIDKKVYIALLSEFSMPSLKFCSFVVPADLLICGSVGLYLCSCVCISMCSIFK